MFEGRKYWEVKEYEPARTSFVRAYEAQKEVAALAWAATTSYWLNDLASAERYIQEAESMPMTRTSISWFRVTGYKALILLRQGKKAEGFAFSRSTFTHTDTPTRLPIFR
jgi:hypothetical protein